jgi:hypothetical protein
MLELGERILDWQGDAPGRNRTCDLALRRRALYPLSYRRRRAQSTEAQAWTTAGDRVRGRLEAGLSAV